MIKKCPWCGDPINVKFGTFGEYKCEHCKNKSVIKRDGWSYWLPALFSLIIILAFRSVFALPSLLLIYLSGVFNSYYAPLRRSAQKYVPVKNAKASFNLKEKMSFISKRITFVEDSIFFICFKDENEKPVSHILAVSVDYIHIEKDNISCELNFLPECEYNTDFAADTRFNIYNNEKLLGEGSITSDVKYKQFPAADNKL